MRVISRCLFCEHTAWNCMRPAHATQLHVAMYTCNTCTAYCHGYMHSPLARQTRLWLFATFIFIEQKARLTHDSRVGPLGSRLRLTSFMRHLHRRAAFFGGGLRDDLYQHFANIVLEIGIRECCQLVDKSLRADWDVFPHSFLLDQGGHVQVPALVACLLAAVNTAYVH